jgi:hypothetical protein
MTTVDNDLVADLLTAHRHIKAMIRQLDRRIARAEQADVEHGDDQSRQTLAQLDRERWIALEQRLDLFAELATYGVSPHQPSDGPPTPTPRLDAAKRALRKIQKQSPT